MNTWHGKILVIWRRGGGQALAEEIGGKLEGAQGGMSILSRGMELWVRRPVGREWRNRQIAKRREWRAVKQTGGRGL